MGTILIVCTGNICRSPMAESILARLLSERGVRGVAVASAGISAWDGSSAAPGAVDAMSEREIDISEHRARRLTADMLRGADLILGMTADHRDVAFQMVAEAGERSFTLKELVKLLDDFRGPGGRIDPDERLRAAVRWADRRRTSDGDALRDTDVADPLGLSMESFRATAWELEGLLTDLVDDLFGQGSGADEAAEGARPRDERASATVWGTGKGGER